MSRRCLPTAASLSRHHLRFLRAITRTERGALPVFLDRDRRTAERLEPLFVRVRDGGRSVTITEAGCAALLRMAGAS